ncbi:activator of the mannose operon, transcriptional antiterminator [Thalassobacillus cyri]|uniref:Activator of the mannose operon, transcriptional antiterminator n=1 Tax=Thalassobacillus cyri TaxID=571932 RepID=A0A1H4A9I2_9BACI|nr:BglG family transcription antiterminator [Thalassobacillus cyri]SEA32649.1 activator of the mannose operon, transcriptional antiterminator [Thalassobacillus cyri]
MNDRQKELIRILALHSDGYKQVKELAAELACSEKTVRNDMKAVEDFLQAYPAASLMRKPGLGVRLSIKQDEKSQLFDQLYRSETKSSEDRLLEITYHLLVNDRPVTLTQLADTYFVNKNVIKNDLALIARWLERFNLALISRQRLGHIIEGGELQKRNALARLPELVSSSTGKNKEIINLFPPFEVNTVRQFLKEMQHHFSVLTGNGDFESLLIHALVMIKRTAQRAPIQLDSAEGANVAETEEYGIATWFLKRLERKLRMPFPEEERVYFALHLLSSKGTHHPFKQAKGSGVTEIVDVLTSKLQKLTLIDFSADETLMAGLHTHMEPTISRIRFGFTIQNPLLSEIKKKYPYMFSMVMLALEEVETEYDLTFPEEEAAYLVLHFQAAVERLHKKRNQAKKVLIVCDLGVGMSHLLQAKLEQSYTGFDVIAAVGEWQVEETLEKHTVDLIISTKPLPEVDVPNLVVSPLLEAQDKKRLDEFLQSMENEIQDGQAMDTLVNLLDEEFIYLGVKQEHRFEVVELMAKGLMEKGRVTSHFPHSALARERSSATSIGGGIAIPHAHTEEVHRSTVAMAILAQPLEWGSEQVSIVFLLAIAKEDQAMTKSLIQAISTISEKPEMVYKLTGAGDTTEVMWLLDQ